MKSTNLKTLLGGASLAILLSTAFSAPATAAAANRAALAADFFSTVSQVKPTDVDLKAAAAAAAAATGGASDSEDESDDESSGPVNFDAVAASGGNLQKAGAFADLLAAYKTAQKAVEKAAEADKDAVTLIKKHSTAKREAEVRAKALLEEKAQVVSQLAQLTDLMAEQARLATEEKQKLVDAQALVAAEANAKGIEAEAKGREAQAAADQARDLETLLTAEKAKSLTLESQVSAAAATVGTHADVVKAAEKAMFEKERAMLEKILVAVGATKDVVLDPAEPDGFKLALSGAAAGGGAKKKKQPKVAAGLDALSGAKIADRATDLNDHIANTLLPTLDLEHQALVDAAAAIVPVDAADDTAADTVAKAAAEKAILDFQYANKKAQLEEASKLLSDTLTDNATIKTVLGRFGINS